MALPIRATVEDVNVVCNYLCTKPTGATVANAKTVIDKKHVDGRKLAALKFWGVIEDASGDKLKVTTLGRNAARGAPEICRNAYLEIITNINPYRSIIERLIHRNETTISATEVAAHWHEHFNKDASDNDKTLNEQALCFFQAAQAAELGTLVVGRKGAPTRFDLDRSNAEDFFAEVSVNSTIEEDSQLNGNNLDDSDHVPVENCETAVDGSSKPLYNDEKDSLGQAIFIAHGKNKKPLEQLKKILDQFKIPYRVAIEEPNLGRPIGDKIREIMRSCNCAILIFTADEEFTNSDGLATGQSHEIMPDFLLNIAISSPNSSSR